MYHAKGTGPRAGCCLRVVSVVQARGSGSATSAAEGRKIPTKGRKVPIKGATLVSYALTHNATLLYPQEAARLAEAEAARERAMIDEVVQRIMDPDSRCPPPPPPSPSAGGRPPGGGGGRPRARHD